MKYKRILLKLSGEALMGTSKKTSMDHDILERYSEEIKKVKDLGVQVAIVIGGGNIFRAVRPRLWALIAYRATTWACWPR